MFACDYEDCCCKPEIGCHNLTEISGIYFCDGTNITPSGGIIHISGDIDMSCHSIFDVSKVGFCCNIILDAHPCPSANIAIGNYIGIDDGSNTISIGNYAGSSGQQNFSIAMGYAAGKSDQKERSIAIGYKAGELNQHSQTIIINAQDASLNSVDPSAFYVAPIRKAANKQLLYYDISSKEITYDLWNVSCGDISDVSNIYFCNGTAILGPSGTHLTISGDLDMSCNRIYDVSKLGFCCNIIIDASMCPSGNIAIGNNIGIDDASNTISIGNYAGSSGQQNFSIAMGCEAGKTDQSKNAIAIGYKAGELNQHSQTIIINAQDASLNSVDPSAFYVAPIRQAANKQLLYYDVFTKEITYDLWNVSCGDISDVSNIYFCNGTAILGLSGEPEPQLTISGNLDMSCNKILDVSSITFCHDIYIDTSFGVLNPNIIIGQNISHSSDGSSNICIGNDINIGDGSENVIIGFGLGNTDICGSNLVLIGANNSTVAHAHKGNIAIGHQANYSPSGDFTISIGYHDRAGQAQKRGAIAIGYNSAISATRPYQGEYSIALGAYAGVTDMCKNSIVINATGSPLNTLDDPSRCYIKPIHDMSTTNITEASNNILFYDASSGEITWGKNPAYIPGKPLDMSCSDISDVSNIYFCNHTAILGLSNETCLTISGDLDMCCNKIIDICGLYFCQGTALQESLKDYPLNFPGPSTNGYVITCSGNLDMSCNNILDVSRIYFCGPIGTGGRNWIGVGTSFDISTNEALKMIVPSDSSASILVGSTPVLQVDASHVSISGGTVDNPALNFGLVGDSMTGMYGVAANTIGFSTGNEQKLTIVGSSTLPAGMIDGINVGTTTNIAGIRRLSATPANSWEDGHLGNSEAIYFTATDFVQGGNPTIGSDGVFSATTTLNPVGLATDLLVHTDTTGGGGVWGVDQYPSRNWGPMQTSRLGIVSGPALSTIAGLSSSTQDANFDFTIKRDATPQIGGQTTQTSSVFMAQKMIPKGFTFEDGVDTCTIFTNTATTVTTLNIYSQDIDSNPTATLLHTQPSYITNTPSAAFSPAETGDGVKSVIIEIDIGNNWTSDITLIGAKITMSRI